MDLVKLMEGKSASRSSIIAAVKARAAAAKLTLQYLEREKEEMLELSRLKCEQEAEEAKARCKAQMETYGISHPVDLTVVSRENSYPAGHFDSIASGPSCEGSIPVSPDISFDSAISSSCLSKPVVHDSFTVPPIFFNGQGNQFHSHCNSFETVSNFGDFHSNSYGNFSVNARSSHDVQHHPISQLNLSFSENFGPICSTMFLVAIHPEVPILLPHPLDHPQMLPLDHLDLFVLHKTPHQCMTTLLVTRISLT